MPLTRPCPKTTVREPLMLTTCVNATTGAKAVIIVNTDDMKTMRLMALPDEIPLIKIPCIMVGVELCCCGCTVL